MRYQSNTVTAYRGAQLQDSYRSSHPCPPHGFDWQKGLGGPAVQCERYRQGAFVPNESREIKAVFAGGRAQPVRRARDPGTYGGRYDWFAGDAGDAVPTNFTPGKADFGVFNGAAVLYVGRALCAHGTVGRARSYPPRQSSLPARASSPASSAA